MQLIYGVQYGKGKFLSVVNANCSDIFYSVYLLWRLKVLQKQFSFRKVVCHFAPVTYNIPDPSSYWSNITKIKLVENVSRGFQFVSQFKNFQSHVRKRAEKEVNHDCIVTPFHLKASLADMSQ